MRFNSGMAFALAVAALAATPALAQQGPGRMMMTPEQRGARFDAADTNKDGKMDKAEWIASMPAQMKERVDDTMLDQMWSARLDADGDGFVTRDEFMNMKPMRQQ